MNIKNSQATVLAGVAAFVAIVGVLYADALQYLVHQWGLEDFNYCVLVPFIVVYLLREKRHQFAAVPAQPSWTGLVVAGAGLALFWLGELGGEYTVMFFSLWLVVCGACLTWQGWKRTQVIGFPLVYSLAMFPPPNFLASTLTLKLKLISSSLGVEMIRLYGQSAYREGNIIDLGYTKLQVVDACSGLRFFFPLIILAILIAYFFKTPWWKKVVLVLSAIPLSIVTNALRIALVGILYKYLGPMVVEGFFHDFSGWIIFMVSIGFLQLEMRLISGPSSSCGDLKDKVPEAAVSAGCCRTLPVQFAAVVAVVAVTLGVAWGVDFREARPVKKPLDQLPEQVAEWTGKRGMLDSGIINQLHLTSYALVDYVNPAGNTINCYVAYNASQSKGQSTHTPATCLPGSGWEFRESGQATIHLNGTRGTMTVSRAFMEKNGSRQLTYYWFPQRGRVLTNIYQLKAYAFWDALTSRRTDGALVRLVTPLAPGETPQAAEARLQGFTRSIVPVLDGFIPGKDV